MLGRLELTSVELVQMSLDRIAALDTPVPFSPPQEEFFLPKVSDVVREARRLKAY